MIWSLFKIIFSIGEFLFAQSVILPWLISNTLIPLWGDILLISMLLVISPFAIDRLAVHVLKFLRRRHEAIE